jgi:large subunit ribosomal protein L3
VISGILGRKVGMTQLFDERGRRVAVTAIEAGPCVVTQIRTASRDGYEAVQIGFGSEKPVNKPEQGHLKGMASFRHLREFSPTGGELPSVGEQVTVEIFQAGDRVDVRGVSKGRGFAGGVKRYHFRGGPKTHGQSDRHRAPGSIGATTTPGRVYKGLRMAGHMGDRTVTVKNLRVVQSDPARNLLLLEGAVPGARRALVEIRKTTE